jgi:hypothetical protein
MKIKIPKELKKALRRACRLFKKNAGKVLRPNAKVLSCWFDSEGVKGVVSYDGFQVIDNKKNSAIEEIIGKELFSDKLVRMMDGIIKDIFDLSSEFLREHSTCGHDLLEVGFTHKMVHFTYLDCEGATIGDSITHKELFKFFQDTSVVNKACKKI